MFCLNYKKFRSVTRNVHSVVRNGHSVIWNGRSVSRNIDLSARDRTNS